MPGSRECATARRWRRGLRRRHSSSRRSPSGWTSSRTSSRSSTPPRPGHADPPPPTPPRCRSPRSAKRPSAAEKVVGFYPASMMPLIEIIDGEDTSQETVAAGHSPGDPQAADRLRRGPGYVNRILKLRDRRGLARAEKGLSIKKIDEGVGAAACRRALLPRQPARTRHRPARRRAPRRGHRRGTLLRPRGTSWPTANSARRPAATASTRPASRTSAARARRGGAVVVELLSVRGVARGLQRRHRGGRRKPPRHRLRRSASTRGAA